MTDIDSPLERCRAELGEPSAVFSVDPTQARGRFVLALCLLIGGIAGNYLFWVHGPARFGAAAAKILLAPPILGGILLYHLHRTRGLHVLAYPTGLLRLQGEAVESYPWVDMAEVRIKATAAEFVTRHDAEGRRIAARLEVEVPSVQVWSVNLTVRRVDETEARFAPMLIGYADLIDLVQTETFRVLWPKAIAEFRNAVPQKFGPLTVAAHGMDFGKKMLPWAEVGEVTMASKGVQIKKKGGWGTWATVPLEQITNPHIFLALVDEARTRVEEKPGNAIAGEPRSHPE